jgi:FSR family fosmidomycin resistance protein-like MFS transporter
VPIAVIKLPHPRSTLVICALFHAINDASFAIVPAVLPLIVTDFSLTYSDVGVLYAAILTVMVLVQPLMGDLADKFNELDLLAIGGFLIFLSFACVFFAGSYVQIFIFNMIYAIGYSIFHPVSYAVLSRVSSDAKSHTRTMGVSGASGDFGNFVALVSTGVIASYLGWRTPFLILGLFALSGVSIYLLFIRSSKKTSFSTLYNHTDSRPETTKQGQGVMSKHSMYVMILISLCMGAGYRTFINFTTLFLTDVVKISPAASASMFSLFVLAAAMGSFSSFYIAKFIGLKKAIILESAIASIAMSLFPMKFMRSIPLLMISLLLNGFVLSAAYPILYSIIAQVASYGGRGRSYGFVMSIIFVGGVVQSYAGGQIAQIANDLSVVYVLGSAIVLLGVLVSIKIPPL